MAREIEQRDAVRSEGGWAEDVAGGPAVRQRIEHFVVADVAACRRPEDSVGRPRTAALSTAAARATCGADRIRSVHVGASTRRTNPIRRRPCRTLHTVVPPEFLISKLVLQRGLASVGNDVAFAAVSTSDVGLSIVDGRLRRRRRYLQRRAVGQRRQWRRGCEDDGATGVSGFFEQARAAARAVADAHTTSVLYCINKPHVAGLGPLG